MTDLADFDSPEFQLDLYANYRRLREEDPVHYHEFNGEPRISLMRFDHVLAAFKDDRFGTIRIPAQILDNLLHSGHRDLTNLARMMSNILIIKDPPDHTRLRGLVSKAFTPRSIEKLRPGIEAIVAELLDAIGGREPMDLIADFAAPLPAIVIAELLGAPTEDRLQLKHWSDDFAPMLDRTLNAAGLLPGAAAATGFTEYFGRIIDQRRAEPRDDLISALVAAKEADDVLSDDELVATCTLILVAGHETTTNLLGNGTLTLLRHPDQLERLRARPEAIPTAVEELLRFESPLQRFVRHLHEDVEVGGTRIPAGTIVDLVIGSANRDPEQFAHPEELDLEREDNRHLAFGVGRHFCLGAKLARLEAEIAFRELLRRFPTLKLSTETPQWRAGSFLRGVHSLPLSF